MMSFHNLTRKLKAWFIQATSLERTLIISIFVVLVFIGIKYPVDSFNHYLDKNERLLSKRKEDLSLLSNLLTQYSSLDKKLTKAKSTYEKSQLTLGELTMQLEQIVKSSLSSENYELNRAGSPIKVGFDYNKQQFTLKIRSSSLEELVKLLHQLEQGKSPLFLGKVDVLKSFRDGEFSSTLEIFSIQKAN